MARFQGLLATPIITLGLTAGIAMAVMKAPATIGTLR